MLWIVIWLVPMLVLSLIHTYEVGELEGVGYCIVFYQIKLCLFSSVFYYSLLNTSEHFKEPDFRIKVTKDKPEQTLTSDSRLPQAFSR